MVEKKKIQVTIKSNGTTEKTSLLVNGVDVTKTQNVTNISFNAYSDGYINISWSVIEKDQKGIDKSSTYYYRYDPYNPNEKQALVKKSVITKIGTDAEIQFETIQDKTSYTVTQQLKTLEEVLEVIDQTVTEEPKKTEEK